MCQGETDLIFDVPGQSKPQLYCHIAKMHTKKHHFQNGPVKIRTDNKFVVELYESVLYPTHKKIEHVKQTEYSFPFGGEDQNIFVVKFKLATVELHYIFSAYHYCNLSVYDDVKGDQLQWMKIRHDMLRDLSFVFTGLPEWALGQNHIDEKDMVEKMINGFVRKYWYDSKESKYIPMDIQGIILLYYIGDDLPSEDEYEDYDEDMDPEWSS